MIVAVTKNTFNFIDLWKGKWYMTEIPNDQHVTYQLQYRKCGKPSCSTCRNTQGHGPYWYAYWREGSRLRSGYVGKVHPSMQGQPVPTPEKKEKGTAPGAILDDFVASPALL